MAGSAGAASRRNNDFSGVFMVMQASHDLLDDLEDILDLYHSDEASADQTVLKIKELLL